MSRYSCKLAGSLRNKRRQWLLDAEALDMANNDDAETGIPRGEWAAAVLRAESRAKRERHLARRRAP